MEYVLTEHAERVLAEREIATEWLERTLATPALREPDPVEKGLERRYLPIPERDGRVLRVIVDPTVVPVRVVSVFFDRTKRGQL